MDVIAAQLKKMEKKEQRIQKKASEGQAQPLGKLQQKIPPKLTGTLEAAFEKGLRAILDKGTIIIEKTYDKEAVSGIHALNDYLVRQNPKRRRLRALDRQAGKVTLQTSVLTAAEGTVLGLLGIGLPDIPIFLGVLLRGLYEVALSYGFPYDTETEKIYLLNLISSALGIAEKREACPQTVDEALTGAAKALTQRLLLAKFIQGIPFVGITGGAANLVIYRKIAGYAAFQYKKRYLLVLQNTQHTNTGPFV